MQSLYEYASSVAVFVFSFFFGSLSRIIEKYPVLFERGDEQIGESVSPFNWLELIHMMAQKDRTKWDFFLQMPLIEFLNALAFYKQQSKERLKRLELASAKGYQNYVIACLNELI